MDALRSQGADLIVFMCHWGIEGNYTPEAGQVDFAHWIIDDGADLFVGAHPHVLQGLEEYHGKMIPYSEGNFCFGGNRESGRQGYDDLSADLYLYGRGSCRTV